MVLYNHIISFMFLWDPPIYHKLKLSLIRQKISYNK